MEIGTDIINESSNPLIEKLKNYFSIANLLLATICLILQVDCFNIIVHTILCSTIIATLVGRLVCTIILNDTKNIYSTGSFIVLWFMNMLIALL